MHEGTLSSQIRDNLGIEINKDRNRFQVIKYNENPRLHGSERGKPAFRAITSKYRRNEDHMATMTKVMDSGESSMDTKPGGQVGEARDTGTTWKLLIRHKEQHGDMKVEKPSRHQRDQMAIMCHLVGGAEVARETLLRCFLPRTCGLSLVVKKHQIAQREGVGPRDGMPVPDATTGPGREPDQEGRKENRRETRTACPDRTKVLHPLWFLSWLGGPLGGCVRASLPGGTHTGVTHG